AAGHVPSSVWQGPFRPTSGETSMKRVLFTLAPLMLAPALLATPALADRAPNPEERAAIEAKLQEEGFIQWKSIELEDDGTIWEVEDASGPDGREYDLDLRFGTLEIVKRDAD